MAYDTQHCQLRSYVAGKYPETLDIFENDSKLGIWTLHRTPEQMPNLLRRSDMTKHTGIGFIKIIQAELPETGGEMMSKSLSHTRGGHKFGILPSEGILSRSFKNRCFES